MTTRSTLSKKTLLCKNNYFLGRQKERLSFHGENEFWYEYILENICHFSSYPTVVYLTGLTVLVEHKKYSEFIMILQDLNVRKKCYVMERSVL